MKSSLELVKEFHEAFGHPIYATEAVTDSSNNDLFNLRTALIREELIELEEALNSRDAVETFDALCDLQYVLDGAFLALGFHKYKDAGMAEVHRSNMSKLGKDGKPIYREDGKILKGPDYTPPALAKILNSD
jgi:predicted HAD superfamily Cof-like phosphohydrolase